MSAHNGVNLRDRSLAYLHAY